MSREWNPGDVAMVTQGASRFYGQRVFRCVDRDGDRIGWAASDTDGLSMAFGDSVLRPLVVIDPEDREQVERLTRANHDAIHGVGHFDALAEIGRSACVDLMQAALREFASPTPPKPDEPMGLGAVVEDADEHVHTRAGRHGQPFVGFDGRWRNYADIAAVRVLSEGVQP